MAGSGAGRAAIAGVGERVGHHLLLVTRDDVRRPYGRTETRVGCLSWCCCCLLAELVRSLGGSSSLQQQTIFHPPHPYFFNLCFSRQVSGSNGHDVEDSENSILQSTGIS